jgi:rfaE bifunctional protein kinase chain/domain
VLTAALIEQLLERAPALTIGVVGDLFLDRYLDLDASRTEPSLETGLDAYQVIGVRSYPGAAGTVVNNLAALGVGQVVPIAAIGDDGEGYELRQALATMPAVDARHILSATDRRTPTYTKPMLGAPGQPARELNRLDIKNRLPTPAALIDRIIAALRELWPRIDALIVLDQVSETDCGAVTAEVRSAVRTLAKSNPRAFVLADSRERTLEFRDVCCIKPNGAECVRAMHINEVVEAVERMANFIGYAVFATVGPDGILLAHPGQSIRRIAGFPVQGPIDPVGAGDCANAAIATAVAAGLSYEDAAAFGCLAASITVQQLGTTGTATPAQVRHRWRELVG